LRQCSEARDYATGGAFLSATVALVAALAGNYLLGAIPAWREAAGRRTLQTNAANVTAHDRGGLAR
jgi:hypothetical protein